MLNETGFKVKLGPVSQIYNSFYLSHFIFFSHDPEHWHKQTDLETKDLTTIVYTYSEDSAKYRYANFISLRRFFSQDSEHRHEQNKSKNYRLYDKSLKSKDVMTWQSKNLSLASSLATQSTG